MKQPIIYVVWGPSPHSGDGIGVLGYALTLEDARIIMGDDAEFDAAYGSTLTWRTTLHECGAVEPVPAKDLGWDEEEDLAAFVERLNTAL